MLTLVLSAVFFSNKFPGVKIVAIEPEKANFKMLEIKKDYENIVLAKMPYQTAQMSVLM
jgi:hypothetical protein